MILYGSMQTSLGRLHYAWEKEGPILFLGCSQLKLFRFLEAEQSVFGGRHPGLEEQIYHYLKGNLQHFSLNIRLKTGTPFFRKVLGTLQNTAYGEVISYKTLAQASGYPRAWRAVGTALAKNPLMILIPCHRVIASSKKIGQFGAGPGIKKALLTLEGAL